VSVPVSVSVEERQSVCFEVTSASKIFCKVFCLSKEKASRSLFLLLTLTLALTLPKQLLYS
jgi:hypothetical protein